jgi:hypothetical protein
MLPCVVTDFFFNNQPDAPIIQNLFCHKTLHVSGIIFAHHQEFSTVHSAMVSFMQVFDDRFQVESGWIYNSILTLLGSGWVGGQETANPPLQQDTIPHAVICSLTLLKMGKSLSETN